MIDAHTAPGPDVLVVGLNGKVLGLDSASGQTLWAHEVGGLGPVEMVVTDHRVLAICVDPAVLCLEYPSGRLLGRAPLPRRQPGGRLLVQGERLFVQGAGQLTCLSVHDGQILWHQILETTSGEYWEMALGFPGNVRPVDRTR